MKTRKNNPFKLIIKTTLLAALLITASCNNDGATKEGDLTVSAPKAKVPEIDIHTAVLSNNMDALKQHIAAGSNLNEKDPFGGSSPLITACIFDKKDMAKTLLEAGAEINFQNNDQSTALHAASFFCRPEIVRLLLDKGADKTIRNKYGSTAYESVSGSFSDAKPTYDMMGQMLAPMGLKLDYTYIEKTRPEIAAMLK